MKANPVEISWNPALPVYASERFLKSESDEFGWIGGTDAAGRLRCFIPYTVIRKVGFRFVRLRTQTLFLSEPISIEDEKSFLNSAMEHFRSAGMDMVVPSGNTAIFRTHPDGAPAAPYGTYVNDLRKPETELNSDIRKTFRQNIRKASEQGVVIKSGPEFLDICYTLVAETLKRSAVSFKKAGDFRRTIMNLGEHAKLFVAEHDGIVQACMVAPFSDYAAYNCYAGTRPSPALGAMHLLHWEAMKHFRTLGVHRFDFQGVRIDPEKGSKQEGIANYKRGFGGQLMTGYTWKYPLRPLGSGLYSLAIRFNGGDIVDLEGQKLAGKPEDVRVS